MSVYKTGAALIDDGKSNVTEVSPKDALALHGQNVVFLDVREPNEWNLGHIPGAIHIPLGQLEVKVETAVDRSKRVVVYCAAGARSALAAQTMLQMGYANVTSLRDGIRGWADAGGEIED
jgi:rhodanese-related sulfurtransferase